MRLLYSADQSSRFLQSPLSNLLLDRTNLKLEQGIASVTCLRAGLQTFRPEATIRAHCLRVVHGLHGFHLYAADHWADDLLDVATTSQVIKDALVYRLAIDLATQSNSNEGQSDDHGEEEFGGDGRLSLIPNVQLRRLMRLCLESRSTKAVEQQIFLTDGERTASKMRKVN